MDAKGKSLKALEGWSPVVSTRGLWAWREGYTLFECPDRKMIAQVDMTDEEVTMIYNREKRKIEFIHPVTERGMKITGVTREQLEAVMGKMNERDI